MEYFKNNRNGITLIELLTVIAIIGVTVSISAAVLKQYQPNIRLYTAGKTLRSELSNARMKTIAEQKTYGIHFTQGLNQYELVLVDGTTETQKTYPLSESISFTSVGPFTNDVVTFNKAGIPSENGSIVLQTADGGTKTITINPSGYVHAD
ncbi:hypothetical protein BK004_02645 [bacterium CG10_46_32]|nr:MAG: hypothetical protein BK004_02645 [bacterium CG10_46_32]PIR56100.1 MAG: hypothetical protein COU73_02670 [Parcubacteria group bacterium CG10_big_fil_rev_8_21_14_0_10_46_32]